MKVMKCMGMLALIAMLGVPMSVLAQQPGSGMKQDHQMGGMQQQGMPGMGMGMMEMCQKMQEGTAQGCKMMEEMKGERQPMVEMKKHLREMKKHMNMLDEMMDGMMDNMMMQRQQGMTPSGSESESQEHHPGESK
ncbi:hypothetical protein [Candidatus Methylomirabilis sp.]|uniref:DUF4175 domain-containing protein n=1 Tax=Candidatus Methylomirabilis tolerans TaxID=3123416 RepID=A0AAJ1AK31_9BACT|nr:hypothetical protein [Candidatus Methylomirabilis sp.]